MALLLIDLFPLLFCPDRVAREFVPIMIIPKVASNGDDGRIVTRWLEAYA